MKIRTKILLAFAGLICAGAATSCTAYVTPPEGTVGASTTTTTAVTPGVYGGTSTERTTIRRY